MRIPERLEALVRAVVRRPLITVGIVIVLALGGGVLALGLKPSAQTDTFVSKSSASYRATQTDYRHFGGNAVDLLVQEPLTTLLEGSGGDIGNLMQLEGCLAGQRVVLNPQKTAFVVDQQAGPLGGRNGPCGQLERTHAVQVVYGPATFLSRSAAAVNSGVSQLESSVKTAELNAAKAAAINAVKHGASKAQAIQAGNAAGQQEGQQQLGNLAALAAQSGLSLASLPASLANTSFVSQVVFGSTAGTANPQPKGRFAYLFPSDNAALIQVRLKASLSTAQQARVISLIRHAVKLKYFRLSDGSYTVSGEPVVISDLTAQITRSIFILLIAAVAVMAVTLLIVFRRRLRLLPLVVALAAAGITFGIIALIGATLTIASIAVLPILIGLGVDYAIQFQSRAQEALSDGAERTAAGDVARAARIGGPTIAVAALATGVGFLVLLLSPVPMVRGFGLLLVMGIAVALICAFTGGAAAQVLFAHRDRRAARRAGGAGVAGAGGAAPAAPGRLAQLLGPSLRGAGEIIADAARGTGRVLGRAGGGTGRLVRDVALGWAELFGDAGRLLASPVRALRRRRRAPADGGRRRGAARAGRTLPGGAPSAAGVISAVVRRPRWVLGLGAVLAVAGWVADTQTSVQSDVTKLVPHSMPALRDLNRLERVTGSSGELDVTVHSGDVATAKVINWMVGYEGRILRHYGYTETKGCRKTTLCPALSLPDLFSGGAGSTSTSSLSDADIQGLLAAVPSYFKQAVITPDHRNATLAFGIRLLPLAKQQQVIDYMRSQLHPPAGVSAQLAGLPVLTAQANQALSSSSRRLLTLLAGLAAVALVLLAVFRRPRRALVPLVPIALATGWSALILWIIGIPLNPMSATLGALVIAISTEFSVLLSERFAEEIESGGDLITTLQRTYRSTGAAVLASGVTAIAGFGVLIFSNITMLRDFGFVTLIDLTVSLVGVLLVLPAALTLAQPRSAGQARSSLRLRRWLRSWILGPPKAAKPRRRARVAAR